MADPLDTIICRTTLRRSFLRRPRIAGRVDSLWWRLPVIIGEATWVDGLWSCPYHLEYGGSLIDFVPARRRKAPRVSPGPQTLRRHRAQLRTRAMGKRLEREQAITLRQAGLSYSEIRARVPVAKATLSGWFRDVGLSKPQRQRLTAKKLEAGRRGGQKVHAERLARVAHNVGAGKAEAYQRIRNRDVRWVLGTALYWAEGSKAKPWAPGGRVGFTNTDPKMLHCIRVWLEEFCAPDEPEIRYSLYIHPTANVERAEAFWASELGIDRLSLRTYFKKHNPSPSRKNIGDGYHGTIRMTVCKSSALLYRICGWIDALADYCGVV